MIIGVGIDVVDVARFLATLERAPGLRERLFTPEERHLPPSSLAARFAAKRAASDATGRVRSEVVKSRSRSPGVRSRERAHRSMSTTSMPTPMTGTVRPALTRP